MSGSYILDSNIIIDIFRADKLILEKVKTFERIYIPVTVLGELYFGAYKSSRTEDHLLQINRLKEVVNILDITEKTTILYGEIKNKLKQRGRPIPENDIWIAAITQEFGYPLVTRDKHFSHILDLEVIML